MIKYHFHLAPRDVPPLGTLKGDRLCHVYSDTSIEERVRYDVWYVEHWSPWLDLWIMLRTVALVLRGDGE